MFPCDRNIEISYVHLLLQDTLLNDNKYRTGTSATSACECGFDRETAEHFLLHCSNYQNIRNNTVQLSLDVINTAKKSLLSHCLEALPLAPF